MSALMWLAAVLATLPLIFLLIHLLREGASSIDLAFFTRMPKPVGETGGGMAHAIAGTLILVATAGAIGLPVGIGAGLYLAEQRGARLATSVRFLSDVLNGMPSIVMASLPALSRQACRTLFGPCWRHCAGRDDDPTGHARHRGNGPNRADRIA
jgi:ABC-type phosphate transport system permease subunit